MSKQKKYVGGSGVLDSIIDKDDNVSRDEYDTTDETFELKDQNENKLLKEVTEDGDETSQIQDDDDNIEREVENEGEDDTCLYNFVDQAGSDDDEPVNLIFDDDENQTNNQIVKPEDRETKPIMTKYERVKILGFRTKQIALGARVMLKNIDGYTPEELATIELEKRSTPIIIERPMPDGKKERWRISELKIVN